MATPTTDALESLLYIYNGYDNARWNYVDAVGTPFDNPAGTGNGVSLTYSFLDFQPAYSVGEETGFGRMNAPMRAATNAVLDHIAELVNIDFMAVAPQRGQLTFATSFQAHSSAYAYIPWFYPTIESGEITAVREDQSAGGVWLDNGTSWMAADWQPGAIGHNVLLHEVGHALGLKHPFEDTGLGGGFVLDVSIDNEAHTVMSYAPAPRSLLLDALPSGSGFNPVYSSLSASSMMMMDIEALQHLYGANRATRSGNTVYDWETNAELLETLWDGGGVDTLDCSNQTLTCRINLGDGEFSSIGLRRTDAEIKLGLDLPSAFNLNLVPIEERLQLYNGANNLGIAKGAIIENATGGSGSDVITGNDVANRLVGGSGKDKLSGGFGNDRLDGGIAVDTLSGQGGNDILLGGASADRMDGGAGNDVFDYNRLTDTGSTIRAADVIIGFVSGADRIDLSTLDAHATRAGNQAFTFIGANAFDGAGLVRFEGGVLYASTDADIAAEFVIRLSGVATLTGADLLL